MADVLNSQLLPFTITPKKADNTDGEIDATSVVVASSDETVLRIIDLVATNTSISGNVNPIAPGTARFTVSADADLGPGMSDILGTSEDITVSQDPSQLAQTFTITFGTPVPKI